MREIKYRAFDHKTGDMFPVHEMQWSDKGELIFFKGRYDYEKDLYTVGGGNPNKMTGTANHEDGLIKRFVIMQYTGIKDKNGKEIYEGDIICYNGGKTESRTKMTVDWIGTGFALSAYKEYWAYDLAECVSSSLVVTGNIYESPKLVGGGSNERD